MFDLSTLPLDKVKDLIAMATKAKPWSLDAADDVLDLLKWGVKQFKSNPLSPIGATDYSQGDDLLCVQALANEETVSDEVIGGGILVSIAVSALIRLAVKLLKDNLG